MEHPRDAPSAAERFSEGVGNVLMATEELRRNVAAAVDSEEDITIHDLRTWQHELEGILHWLDALARWTADDVGGTETADLQRHCQQKAVGVAQHVLSAAFQYVEPDNDDPDESVSGGSHSVPVQEVRRDAQAAIARLTELALQLYHASDSRLAEWQTDADMIQSYVSYQRNTIRARARPAIANLVQLRQEGRIVTPPLSVSGTATEGGLIVQHHDHDNGIDDDDDGDKNGHDMPEMLQFHAPVLTLILSEAAALIHPLLLWKIHLPPPATQQQQQRPSSSIVSSIQKLCDESIAALDEQAQKMVETVSDWFWQDRPVDEWMQKSNDRNTTNHQTELEQRRALAILDGLVDEMAFSCQVLARYQSLIQQQLQNKSSAIGTTLLPEWTWKYAALERFLVMQRWQSALALAAPVHIVLGTAVQVPSVVEDAQYLSTRALERAASTRSLQAAGTVAHAVSHDVWSMEEDAAGGVYQALLDQRGCWSSVAATQEQEQQTEVATAKEKKENAFASALLDALDEDLGPDSKSPTLEKAPSSNPPTSGGFLSAIVRGDNEKMEQMQLDMEFCVLNGIHATSEACRSLVAFLDALLASPDDEDNDAWAATDADNEKATAMIQLAREELFRFAGGYQKMLTSSMKATFASWCGELNSEALTSSSMRSKKRRQKPLNHLKSFFEKEQYNLQSNDFAKLEADERLERDFIRPLQESIFFQQLPEKCDEEVMRQAAEHMTLTFVNLIIACLWQSERKFTDWGSLLLSKQVRMLQAFVARVTDPSMSVGGRTTVDRGVGGASLIHKWERLSQVVAVLQLEKPADWLAYSSILTADELGRTMSLRVDFPAEAIHAVVTSIGKQEPPSS